MRKWYSTIVVLALASLATSLPPGQDPDLTDAVRRETITALMKQLEENYAIPEKGAEANEMLRLALASGKYDDAKDGRSFASRLSKDVNAILNDGHFRVQFSAQSQPVQQVSAGHVDDGAMQKRIRRRNGNVEIVQHLPGNIGYIELTGFAEPSQGRRPMAAAMQFVQDTEDEGWKRRLRSTLRLLERSGQ